jgi:ubiquinone/menaquinone biosynthesis C-methylase UbiE
LNQYIEKKLENLLVNEIKRLQSLGQLKQAERLARIIIEHNPYELETNQLLINLFSKQSRYEEICELLLNMHEAMPDNDEITHKLSIAFQRINNLEKSLLFASKTLSLTKNVNDYTSVYSDLYYDLAFKSYNDAAEHILLTCFENKNISHQKIYKPWRTLLENAQQLEKFWEIAQYNSYEEFISKIKTSELIDAFNYQLLTSGLKLMIYPSPEFEKIMTFIRRSLLTEYNEEFLASIQNFLSSLGQHCYYNEYIFEITDHELEYLKSLDFSKDHDILLYSCFKPLYECDAGDSIMKAYNTHKNRPLNEVIQLQLLNPSKEEELKQSITQLTSIENKISQTVQAQYEDHPYPRWLYMDKLKLSGQQKSASKDRTILIAGCGTGKEAIINSMLFPYAKITAIDISMSSLTYAKRKTEELGITNITFSQADILKLQETNQTFDFIASSGVIHHMEEPQKGLNALKDRLKKGGLIKLGLYSERGRSTIVKCHKKIKEMGLGNTVEDIKAFRNYIFSDDANEELKEITRWTSFFSLSECRDLLFHVQEHRFTPLTLSELLEKSSMRFLGFKLRDPKLQKAYSLKYPDDIMRTNLNNWDDFENEHPETFSLMYFLWCARKKDYREEAFPEWIKQALGQWLH